MAFDYLSRIYRYLALNFKTFHEKALICNYIQRHTCMCFVIDHYEIRIGFRRHQLKEIITEKNLKINDDEG